MKKVKGTRGCNFKDNVKIVKGKAPKGTKKAKIVKVKKIKNK